MRSSVGGRVVAPGPRIGTVCVTAAASRCIMGNAQRVINSGVRGVVAAAGERLVFLADHVLFGIVLAPPQHE